MLQNGYVLWERQSRMAHPIPEMRGSFTMGKLEEERHEEDQRAIVAYLVELRNHLHCRGVGVLRWPQGLTVPRIRIAMESLFLTIIQNGDTAVQS